MKLKVKNFNWLAGRPVVILNQETAAELNVHVDERVSLSENHKIFAIVDTFENLVQTGEIGLSEEISRILNKKDNSFIEVSPAGVSVAGQLIKKKLSGERLTEKEIQILVSNIVENDLTESEIAYFVSAEKLNGLSRNETIYLTKAMIENGNKLHFNKKIIADKHCTGGIAGNRTTPIVVAICASAGLTLPKTSSRAITSASGTADVIETISRVDFSAKEIEKIVKKVGACLVWGGSLGLAPSDDKIIHVERILNLDIEPQLLSSIMSKKISAGSNHILIDIPYGDGAKTRNLKTAKKLAYHFEDLAKYFKVKLRCVFTKANMPIGNGIGPILEMQDVISVLRNNGPKDLREKSLYLAEELMSLCGIKDSKKKAKQILESGQAYTKFKEIINTQNNREKNSNDFEKRIARLSPARFQENIYAEKSGKIKEIDNKKINSVCRILGTPETISAGVFLHKKLEKVKKGDKILTLYSESKSRLNDAKKFFKESKPIVVK